MATPDELLAAIDTRLQSMDTKLDQLLQRTTDPTEPGAPEEPGAPQEPDQLPAIVGIAGTLSLDRRLTLRWLPEAPYVAYERHESTVDPEHTLKDTVATASCTTGRLAARTSPLRFGIRGITQNGRRGPWSAAVLVQVTQLGGTVTVTDQPFDAAQPSEPSEPGQPQEPPASGGDIPSARRPVDILPILADWTIMLPTGTDGDPDNDYPDTFPGGQVADTFFAARDDHGDHVVFRVHPATGVHSSGSLYPRSEGRQMVPGRRWAKSGWPSSEPHVLTATLAIETDQLAHPDVNGVQVHDGVDDVLQLKSRDGVLGISHNDGDSWEVLDPAYAGQVFDVRVQITGTGEIVIAYTRPGVSRSIRIAKTGKGWFWKVGCYANTGGAKKEKPEPASAVCQVRIYALECTPR